MTANTFLPAPYRIADVIRETELEYTFRVEAQIPVSHGQFFQVSLPRIGEAPISVSGIEDRWLDLTIRNVGSVTRRVFDLQPGDTLFMRGPYGTSFPVESFRGRDLVVIAGGTGIAPVRSMLKHFYARPREVSSLHLVVGFKDPRSILFAEELAAFTSMFNTIYTLDRGQAEGFQTGLVTEHIRKIPFAQFEDYNIVVVGPPVMMRNAALECLRNGVADEKIWVSFERKMSCAIGKCGHCKINETYVCLEGPVFNYRTALELLD